MDECRFDNWTRMLGALQDRRVALKEMVAAAVALTALARADLGFAQEEDALIEGCRLTGDPCSRDRQCCSNDCKGRRRRSRRRDKRDGDRRRRRDRDRNDGTCGCRGNGKSCTRDAACCGGRCDPFDNVCRCVGANGICNVDGDCCGSRICETDANGNKFCKGGRRGRRDRRDRDRRNRRD
jgi:hypothetical protein